MEVAPDAIPDEWWDKLPVNPYGPPFTQVALYCNTREVLDLMVQACRDLGYDEWVTDIARQYGEVFDIRKPTFNVRPTMIDAYMAFNYQIIEHVEFELMYWEHIYHAPLHQHPFETKRAAPCMTYRTECTFAEEQRMLEKYSMRPWYRFVTKSHENPNVQGKARYRDTMYDTYDELGFNLRFCAKLPHEPYFVVPRGSGVELNPVYWGHDISDSEFIDGKWYRHGWEPT